jgi:hypothetical protein
MERDEMLKVLRNSGLREVDYDGEPQGIFYLLDPHIFHKPPFAELAGKYLVIPYPIDRPPIKLQKFYLTLEEEGWEKPIYVTWYVPIPEGVDVREPT